MDFSEPLLIIKAFSKREYMEDFLNGNLYMNNLSFFRKEDVSGELRDDALEGVTLLRKPEMITMTLQDGTKIEPIGNVVFSNFAVDYQKIFCCYGIKAQDIDQNNRNAIGLFPVEALSNLGPYFVLVIDVGSFLDRFEKACNQQKCLGFHYDFVKYIDLSRDIYTQERNLFSACFSKDIKFSHQKEFRFAIPPCSSSDRDPMLLNIGRIDDIAKPFYGIEALKQAERNLKFTFI